MATMRVRITPPRNATAFMDLGNPMTARFASEEVDEGADDQAADRGDGESPVPGETLCDNEGVVSLGEQAFAHHHHGHLRFRRRQRIGPRGSSSERPPPRSRRAADYDCSAHHIDCPPRRSTRDCWVEVAIGVSPSERDGGNEEPAEARCLRGRAPALPRSLSPDILERIPARCLRGRAPALPRSRRPGIPSVAG